MGNEVGQLIANPLAGALQGRFGPKETGLRYDDRTGLFRDAESGAFYDDSRGIFFKRGEDGKFQEVVDPQWLKEERESFEAELTAQQPGRVQQAPTAGAKRLYAFFHDNDGKELALKWLREAQQNYESTTGSYLTSTGEKKEYTVIGPEGYPERVQEYLEAISKSDFGQQMLDGIAAGDQRLDIVFSPNRLKSTEARADVNPVNPGTTIFFDPDVTSKTKFRAELEPVAIKNPNWFQEFFNITHETPKTEERFFKPELALAHELFHAWQNVGTAPQGRDYFPEVFRADLDRKPLEVYAMRFTNQIRIDLGLGYVRKQYVLNAPFNINEDTYENALERWNRHRPSAPTPKTEQ